MLIEKVKLVVGITAFATGVHAALPSESIYDQTCVACHGEEGKDAFPAFPHSAEKMASCRSSTMFS